MKKWKISRGTVVALLFGGMFLVLAARLFELQIIRGSEYQQNFMIKSTKEITVKGTRGMIRDRNGVVLADNKMTEQRGRSMGAAERGNAYAI